MLRKCLNSFILLIFFVPSAIYGKSDHLFRYGAGFQIADQTYIGGNLYYSPPYLHSTIHELGINAFWYLSGGFSITEEQPSVRLDEWNNLELTYRINISPVSVKVHFYTINSHRFNDVDFTSNERLLRQISISYLGNRNEIELFISPKAHQQAFGISFSKMFTLK